MPLPRSLLFIALSFSIASCKNQPPPAASQPAEFSQNTLQLSKRYPAVVQRGIATLRGGQLQPAQDRDGRDSQLALNGAIFFKNSYPPIHAKADEILLNDHHAEARGRFVVKKEGLLYLGQSTTSRAVIDGVQLLFEGPYLIRTAGAIQEFPTTGGGVKRPPAPQQKTAPPKVFRAPSAKPRSASSKPPAPPQIDRSKLLELMRAPD